MEKWKEIWNAKKVNNEILSNSCLEAVFMELKRMDGNDTLTEKGGVTYSAFRKQYNSLVGYLQGDKDRVNRVFEAGCGSGPFLLLLELDGKQVGGLDYSASHIDTARKVLKSPIELYCEEALDMQTDIKYDCVFTNSMFEYFPDYEYASKVLEKMFEKSMYSVAVLDVHDRVKEKAYTAYRRLIIHNYDKKYADLKKLFYEKEFFVDFASSHNMDIRITTSKLEGYWNRDFVFDVYLYKNN